MQSVSINIYLDIENALLTDKTFKTEAIIDNFH